MYKKILTAFICIAVGTACLFSTGLSALAKEEDTPQLLLISFKNAVIDGGFSPQTMEYALILDDTQITPTLESYAVKGNADIFISYNRDETNHPTGITATLQYDTGSTIYNFIYKNPAVYEVNSNNLLSGIYCTYGEISPAINDKDTAYKLYIPSDLKSFCITPSTQDINAYCGVVNLMLTEEQEPVITLKSIASDGSEREYSIKIKRVNKTIQEVRAEMSQKDFTSFVEGTKLYERPEFITVAGGIVVGALVIYIMFALTRRTTINPYDKDEKPFYSPVD